jgi:HEAT repeat protein
MRILVLLAAVSLLSGCSKASPTLSGGKPIEHWIKALNDPDGATRRTAVQKLGNVGPADPAVFPALLGALDDGDADVRCDVILALLKFGPKAKDASVALAEIRQRDPDAKVRAYAVKALAKIEQIS